MKKLLTVIAILFSCLIVHPAFASTHHTTTIAHIHTHRMHLYNHNPKQVLNTKTHTVKTHTHTTSSHVTHSHVVSVTPLTVSTIDPLQLTPKQDKVTSVYYADGYYKFDTTSGYTVNVLQSNQNDFTTQYLSNWLNGQSVNLYIHKQGSDNQEDWFVSNWSIVTPNTL
jgi:G3E family GTPase